MGFSSVSSRVSLRDLFLTTVVIVVVLVYLMVAFFTQDFLWFWPVFSERPSSVVVHCDGAAVPLAPGSPEYETLVEAFNQSLFGMKRWSSLTMSDETYAYYQENGVVLEMYYSPPVRVHSHTRFFSDVDTMVIPLTGRHADYYPVFGRVRGQLKPGALHLKTSAPLLELVNSEFVCP